MKRRERNKLKVTLPRLDMKKKKIKKIKEQKNVTVPHISSSDVKCFGVFA